MTTTIPATPLTGSLLRTYNTIFQHPVAHNLEWRHVHTLFRHLGSVEEEPNGNLKVTRNGESLVLHPPRSKDVAETSELMALRHFLERSEPTEAGAKGTGANWLLVLNHHEIALYRSLESGTEALLIRPAAPEVSLQQTPHPKDFSRGQEKPDPDVFFARVVPELPGTAPLLLFGSGTGGGNEMDRFATWLGRHHPELARRIVASVVVDQHHLTEAQLLAQAREYFVHHSGSRP